ncbi:hypothetical protein [Pseudomonas syringae]|uniref:hypothetical protein n=1 Tax=Pseudomonas syringae TaxID=317 RepID=UPI0012AECB13|nr:hypothetical protein [Pseudomonas syringae]
MNQFIKARSKISSIVRCFCYAYSLCLPLTAHAWFPDCDEIQGLLTSSEWLHEGSGIYLTYKQTGFYKGVQFENSAPKLSYELQNYSLQRNDKEVEQVCQITFEYADGECSGDVDGFFVEQVGSSLRFRTYRRIGTSRWNADYTAVSCERGEAFTMVLAD